MQRIKTLLIVFLVIAFSFSLIGCKLLPWGSSADVETGTEDGLPEWLMLAHRAEAAEEPEVDEEEVDEDEPSVSESASTQPSTTQPATTQPAATQPTTEQPAQSSGTPKWQEPGTMEYLAKLQLDQGAIDYGRLNTRISNPDYKDDWPQLKSERAYILAWMSELASKIGLDLKQVYGITPPAASSGDSGGLNHTFDTMDSPSGWGN
jgi:hypothetical protein